MVAETGVRMIAWQDQFWISYYNIADFVILFICLIIFVLVMNTSCSIETSREAFIEEILLIARNLIQLVRLAMMLKRF
jgi:hypothetical protein